MKRVACCIDQPREEVPKEIYVLIVAELDTVGKFRFATTCRLFNQLVHSTTTEIPCPPLKITDAVLMRLPHLTSLDLTENEKVSNRSLSKLTRMKILNLSGVEDITEGGLLTLTNLTSLNLNENSSISHTALFPMKFLRDLTISCYDTFEEGFHCNESLSSLVSLTSLDLTGNVNIEDHHIQPLTNLKKLIIKSTCGITEDGIRFLTSLESLDVEKNDAIGPDFIASLCHITELDISDRGDCPNLERMTNLKKLYLREDSHPDMNQMLSKLTTLTLLDITYNAKITDDTIGNLHNLTSLTFKYSTNITLESISKLSNLSEISLSFTYDSIIRSLKDPEYLPNITLINGYYRENLLKWPGLCSGNDSTSDSDD